MAKRSFGIALAVAAMALPSAPALAAVSIDVSTGKPGQGSNSNRDINWLVSGGAVQGGPEQAYIPTLVFSTWAGGASNPATADGARWITPTSNGRESLPVGTYTYTTAFELPDITQLVDLMLSGTFWADNRVQSISINGITTAYASTYPGNAFGDPGATFALTNGFRTGTNNLTVNVRNAGTAANATGFRLAAFVTASAVPEPGTWMLMLLGFGAIGFSMRYRAKPQQLALRG